MTPSVTFVHRPSTPRDCNFREISELSYGTVLGRRLEHASRALQNAEHSNPH